VFIVLPLVIYCLSYYPYWNAETETRAWHEIILSNQEAMFDYHSNLTATHPFQSSWYTWPTMEKPMWFYSGPQDAENMSAIYAFGNPIVWWTGFIAMLAGIGVLYSRLFDCKVKENGIRHTKGFFGWFDSGEKGLSDNTERDSRTLLFLVIGVACNLIPWMGVSRCIFIYHYFATVPFIILFTVYMLRYISRYDVRIGAGITIGLSVLAIIAFIMFLPVWTGTSVSRDYVDTWLRWKDNWFVEYFPRG
jgi:dolichyl-phosphate-mannose--protein O-mannosyl transferase